MVRSANEKSPATYLACLLWTVGCGVLIWSDLGVLVFFGSILFCIWAFGLRDKFSNEETASAYSVFNQNQQAIAGTLTAGQVDRQLRGGLGGGGGGTSNSSSIAMASQPSISSTTTTKLSEDERLRRRKAAALAAERRFQQSTEQ